MVPGTEGTRGWIIPIPTSPPIPKPKLRERKAENTGLAPTLQGLFLLGQAGGGPSALGEKPTPAQGWLHGLASALPLSHPKGSERQNVG